LPTKRKKHNKPMPLLGGVGIFIGFFIGYIGFVRPFDKKFLYVLIAALLVVIIGLVDDWHKTKGREFGIIPRLVVQIGAATLVYKAGIVFSGYNNPFTHTYIVLPQALRYLLTVIWIIGVTTVINWSDGMDGLAGGLSAISGATLFVVAIVKGQADSASMSILLVGIVLGFLRYNKHPAQIFVGDSGANFLGFMLAIIALDGAFKQTTVISIFIPILALGVPIFDSIFVIFKRFIEGKPIYKADRSQMHYRLESKGMNEIQVVSFICLISTCLCLFSIIILLLKI
jgi:UDP-GlcNAc:undecaprenyl-phosphate/decaprenyl-phosphate GlcNAc-1-phosphate transferase